jgi:hypothetical protein
MVEPKIAKILPIWASIARDFADRCRHGLKNLVLGILNAVVIGVVFVGLWWATAEWVRATTSAC